LKNKTIQSDYNTPDSTEAWTDLITWAKRRLLGRAAFERLLRQQLGCEGAERQDPVPPPVRRSYTLARAVCSRVDVDDVRGASRQEDRRAGSNVFRGPASQTPDMSKSTSRNRRFAPTADTHTRAADDSPEADARRDQTTLNQLTGPRAGHARQSLQLATLNVAVLF